MRHIQSSNDLSIHFLNENGFDGSAFKVQIKEKTEPRRITVPHGQERIDAISKASTHGKLFHATGGTHLTSDDIFIATEKKVREGEFSTLKKKKEKCTQMHMQSVETDAKELLERGPPYKLPELKAILKYHQVKGCSSLNKPAAEAKLQEIIGRGTHAPDYGDWTDADEQKLLTLTTKPLVWGRLRTVKRMELHAAINHMSKEEREDIRNKMNAADDMEVDVEPASIVPILPNLAGESTPPTSAAQLFPDEMSDVEDDGIQAEVV
jgi:hypothetical protein